MIVLFRFVTCTHVVFGCYMLLVATQCYWLLEMLLVATHVYLLVATDVVTHCYTCCYWLSDVVTGCHRCCLWLSGCSICVSVCSGRPLTPPAQTQTQTCLITAPSICSRRGGTSCWSWPHNPRWDNDCLLYTGNATMCHNLIIGKWASLSMLT